jgi:uncharacterized protein (UPF0276 family)
LRLVSPEELSVPKLGVGLEYQPQLRPFIEASPEAFDFLEVVPDIVWTDLGPGSQPRYLEDREGVAFLEEVARSKPVIPHGIGLSIGSAHGFNRDHVEQMAQWHDRMRFPWHSDHLSYHLADHGAEEVNVNITLPLNLDEETLELLTRRVLEIRERIPTPFLLENNVYYFDMEGQAYDEPGFLSALSDASGCGLLLDLHNLHVNCRNHGTDPYAFLDRLDLDRVVELHVAGGMEFDGLYLDAHSGPSPEPVWELLDRVLPRCPNVGGVVFELFGTWFDRMGEDSLRRQLAGMRELWSRHQPAPVVAANR